MTSVSSGKRLEAVREARGHVEHAAGLRVEVEALPAAEARAFRADVDDHVVDGALHAAHQLHLAVRRGAGSACPGASPSRGCASGWTAGRRSRARRGRTPRRRRCGRRSRARRRASPARSSPRPARSVGVNFIDFSCKQRDRGTTAKATKGDGMILVDSALARHAAARQAPDPGRHDRRGLHGLGRAAADQHRAPRHHAGGGDRQPHAAEGGRRLCRRRPGRRRRLRRAPRRSRAPSRPGARR